MQTTCERISAFVVCAVMGWAGIAAAMPDAPWREVVQPWLSYRGRTFAEGGKTPTHAIRELDQMLGRYHTGTNLSPAQIEENQQIKHQVLHGTFDIRELCRVALGRHWTGLTDTERNGFVQLMIDLLEEKAILSKEQGQKKTKGGSVYAVSYRGDKFLDPIKSRALTRTNVSVTSEGVRVDLDYKLRRNSDQWKIYDVIVDGSSLAENYQYQFDSIITKNGFPELVRRMEKKLGEIRTQKAQ